jgi:hypothetical protein
MATSTNLRARRNEAQLHALAGVEREIRTVDPSRQRKYLRDFSQAFRSYESVLHPEELKTLIGCADLVLVGDYHALPACQRFAATLLEERTQPADRPVVLGVETIFSRDQPILEEWWRREIDEAELRRRIRFDLDWGYDWAPFYELLVTAREHAEAIYALDCMPRADLRKIGARDRHAAHKIEEIRQRHPQAVITVLFGESHLAPGHLPRLLRERMPEAKMLTVLQNVDALYWRAAGEQPQSVHAVRLAEDTVCVFNSTPLEKYENYRLTLSRWRRSADEGPDLTPTIYNLIDSLLRFLGIHLYSSHNSTQPKFLVDLLPEVFGNLPDSQLRRLLRRETAQEEELQSLLKKIDERGSLYLPRGNAFYVREFQMGYAAEEAARFLHNACQGLASGAASRTTEDSPQPPDRFYIQTLQQAFGYFGSRALYPARDGIDLSLKACENLAESAPPSAAPELDDTAQKLGYALGSDLYDRYLEGSVTRSQLRRLFLAHLEEPGRARKICAELLASHRLGRKGPYPDHSSRAVRSRPA